MVTERRYLVATLIKDWCCSMEPPGPVWPYSLGNMLQAPRERLSPGSHEAQTPWSPFSRHKKCHLSCMALSSTTQLWCKQSSLCFHPRDELISGRLFQSLVHYRFAFAWSRIWEEATSLDSLNAPSGPLHWLYTVLATSLVWTIYLRLRLSGIRLEGQFMKACKLIRHR